MRKPDFCQDYFVFITDDDLWKVEKNLSSYEPNEILDAVRITSNRSRVLEAKISPDGNKIAYLSNESGEIDCYLISRYGGEVKRLSYYGDTKLIGWKDNNSVFLSSSNNKYQCYSLKEINVNSLREKPKELGPVDYYSKSDSGDEIIGRNISDLAFWKGYQGGTTGQIWLKTKNSKNYKRILDRSKSNLSAVSVYSSDIYYLSDKDGCGNIYSYSISSGKSKKLTNNSEFYIRDYAVGEPGLIFSSSGELYFRDTSRANSLKLNIRVISSFEESRKRFVPTKHYTHSFDCNKEATAIVSIVRGKMFCMKPWIGSAREIITKGVSRFRNVYSGGDSSSYYVVGTIESGEDRIFQLSLDINTFDYSFKTICSKNLGKIDEIVLSKDLNSIAISTFRNELWYIGNLSKKSPSKPILINSGSSIFFGHDFSRDSNWVAYSLSKSKSDRSELWIYDVKKNKNTKLLNSISSDYQPVFDLKEDRLYFIGRRELNPIQSEAHFGLSFPDVKKPYVLYLNKNATSLFDTPLNHDTDSEDGEKSEVYFSDSYHDRMAFNLEVAKNSSKKTSKKVVTKSKKSKSTKTPKKEKTTPLIIDFDGIASRIQPFPFKPGGWEKIFVSEDRLFFERVYETNSKIQEDASSVQSQLISYNIGDGTVEVVDDDYEGGLVSLDGKWILLSDDHDLRLFQSDSLPTEGSEYSRKDGWVEMERIKAAILPKDEWKQIYQEAWQLQKEHLFNPNNQDVDFELIYKKYFPLISKVHTRSELSDLIRDMQGDLKTSHAYEFYGDYVFGSKDNRVGKLGAELEYNESKKLYTVKNILKGDNWNSKEYSPLTAVGVDIREGDQIYKVDGVGFDNPNSLYQLLQNKVEEYVDLEVLRKGKRKKELVTVVTTSKGSRLSYRNWVEGNRDYVHKKTKGKTGYIHIPNMGLYGYAEFFKGFLQECTKESLIVDVRYNGGGFVSQLILQMIAQQKIAKTESRWGGYKQSYPMYLNADKMVCLINEMAGSDGDIFPYAFKKLKQGPLVGTRTWGGVIGIWPKIKMVDGTVVTQPEYNFEFDDKSGVLENTGTKPDYEVDITPDDWLKKRDPQMDKAIELLK